MGLPTMAWLSGNSNNANNDNTTFSPFWLNKYKSESPQETLQILSFETAKTMSRLVALYRFISNDELLHLRNGVMKSGGITYLNSDDESFLLNLAYREKLEDLDYAATNVSRLAWKCSDSNLHQFGEIYENLKRGSADIDKPKFSKIYGDKIVKKMEKHVSVTENLHKALESLAEMELSERRLQQWKLSLDPKLPQKTNTIPFEEKIAFQRKQVKRLQEISLWNQTIDKSVSLMAKMVFVNYARICELFSPFVLGLNNRRLQIVSISKPIPTVKVHPELDHCLLADKNNFIQRRGVMSGPIRKSSRNLDTKRFYSQALSSTGQGNRDMTQSLIKSAPPSTVGGAGLALLYANIIILAERYLQSLKDLSEDERDFMYEMLPARIKAMIRRKLKKRWNKEVEEEGHDGDELAEQWREAVEDILGWLAPMAHDTVQWQTERNLEKQSFDAKPTVLLLQTLHFSDLEKTEAAIVEVLVGLSCIYWYENPRRPQCGHVGYNGGYDSEDEEFPYCR